MRPIQMSAVLCGIGIWVCMAPVVAMRAYDGVALGVAQAVGDVQEASLQAAARAEHDAARNFPDWLRATLRRGLGHAHEWTDVVQGFEGPVADGGDAGGYAAVADSASSRLSARPTAELSGRMLSSIDRRVGFDQPAGRRNAVGSLGARLLAVSPDLGGLDALRAHRRMLRNRSWDRSLIETALKARAIDDRIRKHALHLLFMEAEVDEATLIGALVGFLETVGPSHGLALLGFTAAGPAANSVAALVKSRFPGVDPSTWSAVAHGVNLNSVAWLTGYGMVVRAYTFSFPMGHRAGHRIVVLHDRETLEAVLSRSLMDQKMRALLRRQIRKATITERFNGVVRRIVGPDR